VIILDNNVKLIENQKGISLVEVIVSILLISILLISIFGLILQSAKTTKSSEDIVNGTYKAQTEMEKLYKFALEDDNENKLPIDLSTLNFERYLYKECKLIDKNNPEIIKGNCSSNTPVDTHEAYIFEKEDSVYLLLTIIKLDSDSKLTRATIDVYDNKGKQQILKAHVENTIEWDKVE